ncbi:MAG: LPXTG cell wall anchor domain-containing protein, partial [Lachnospiraceae bacterium]|nr:LPXTG cell wall anchor domain-containing protein [Lachnospiraceae bacterium]
ERHSKKKEQKKTEEKPPKEEEFFEEEVPLSDIPEIPEVVVVDEPIIEEVEIGEGDVILSDIPKTGDPSLVWLALSGISGLALAIRKRR